MQRQPLHDRLAGFNSLQRPLIWVPGDNDWTDCWGRYGPGQLPYSDPIERLDHERAVFDSTSQSLGRHTLTLTRESSEGGQYAIYSENVRWVYGPVVYLAWTSRARTTTTRITTPTPRIRPLPSAATPRSSGSATRRSRGRRRTSTGSRRASRTRRPIHAKGVLIDWQADPKFNNEQHLTNPHDYDAFADYVNELRTETLAFPGQVVLVHGDSHYFKMDKPLTLPSGKVLSNFTRIETFGAASTHWVRPRSTRATGTCSRSSR